MKKSKIPIIVILILILMIIPVQNQGVQEAEPSLDSLRPSLRESFSLGEPSNYKPQTHMIIYDVAKTAGNPQDNQDTSKPLKDRRRNPVASIKGISEYTERGPIAILNDSAFGSDGYDFPGGGSSSNPYIIDGYNITDSTAHLIHIENTTKYFNITNCFLNSSNSVYHCIWMKNVTFGTIVDNTICNATQTHYGIGMDESLNNTLLNNTILGCDNGIWMDDSHNNSLLNNTVYDSYWGMYVYRSNDNAFTNNTIYNCFSDGIYLDKDNKRNTFTNNTIYDIAMGYGISTAGGCDNNTFAGNTIYNCGINGFEVSSSQNNTLLGNTIYGCAEGIGLDSANYNNLSGNTIHHCGTNIYLSSSRNNTLSGNTVYDNNQETSITLSSSRNNTLSDNTIYNCGLAGIYMISSCNNNTLSGNTIYNSDDDGIYMSSSSNNTLSGNTIYTNGRGIYLSSSSNNNTLSGNTVYDCNTGLELSSSNNNTLISNIIYDILGLATGIRLGNSHNNTLVGNTIFNVTDSQAIYLSSSNNNTFSSNTIYNITGMFSSGFYIWNSRYNTFNTNTIYRCEYSGFRLTSSSNNNTLLSNTLYNCSIGINLGESKNNTMIDNIIYDCVTGMILSSANNNTLVGNTIHDILGGATGISLQSSNYNTLSGNTIYDIDDGDGIYLGSSNYNSLTDNAIYNVLNSNGISMHDSHNCTLSKNTIDNCNVYGIYIYDSSNNTVCYNIISNNTIFGLFINSSVSPVSENNTVIWNNFVDNYKLGPSQAYDSESNNVIKYNYWEDWTSPDSDLDGFVDDPYFVYNDTANNEDPYPRVYPWMYHEPIYIDDNADFATLGFSGAGTQGDPYVISHYYFASTSALVLISITDTTAFFTIENNIINGLGSNAVCISLYNVINGQIKDNLVCNNTNVGIGLAFGSNYNSISNNTIHDLSTVDSGISLVFSCNNNALFNNTVYYCATGVYVSTNSNNNNLTDNTIYNCTSTGISMGSNSNFNTLTGNTIYYSDFAGFSLFSHNNTLTGNTIFNCPLYGIYLDDSHNNTLTGNTIFNCSMRGILLEDGSKYNTLTGNTAFNCTNDGIRLEDSADNNTLSGNTIHDCGTGIFIDSAHNNTISDNLIYNIEGVTTGIHLLFSDFNILLNNTIDNCTSSSGIWLNDSHNNTLRYNTIHDCDLHGIYIYDSSNNTIWSNIINKSVNYGLSITFSSSSSENNTVKWNNFLINNAGGTSQASDNQQNNVFMYNYWDNHTSPDSEPDGFVDTPFAIDGGSNTDPSPRTYPWMYHEPIYIDDNADFAALGFAGDGAQGNPYVISNYYFLDSKNVLIHIDSTTAYFIINSSILNCLGSSNNAIELLSVFNGIIENNIIYNNTNSEGIYLFDSHNNSLIYNAIFNCTNSYAIYLWESSNNTIHYNIVYNNTYYGVYISSGLFADSENNTVKWNDFLNNYPAGTSQAYDSDSLNTFMYNHWDDWTSPDDDGDGVVDTAYDLDGTAANTDPYSVASPNNKMAFHHLTPLTVLHPNGGEFLAGTITIQWTSSVDSLGHTVTYTVYYSAGGPWIAIDSGLTTNNLQWDTSSVTDGSNYLINVSVRCSGGLTRNNVSDGTFTIDNTLPVISLESPGNNNTVHSSGTTIDVAVTDPHLHTVLYNWNGTTNQTWPTSYQTSLPTNDVQHQLFVYANDSTGRWASIIFVFTTDDMIPTILLESPKNNTAHRSGTTIDVAVSDPHLHTVLYNWNGTTNQTWNTLYQTNLPVNEEQHTLYIYANDSVGHWASAVFVFITDNTVPLISLESPTNDTVYQSGTIIDVMVDSLNLDTVLYNWDGNANQTWSGTYETFLPPGEKQHVLNVYANNSFDHWASAVFAFTTDDTSPVIDITSPTNKTYNQNSVTLAYTVSDGTVTIYLNGLANETAYPTGYIVSNIPDGSYNLTIVAVDIAGNIGKETILGMIDTIPPAVVIASPIATTYNQDSLTLSYTVSDGTVTTVTIFIDDIANTSTLVSGSTISDLTDGSHNITIVAVDSVGHTNHASVIFTIDTTTTIPPTTTTPPTTTIPPTTPTMTTTTTTTTTTAAPGSFPGLLSVLFFFGIMVVFLRRSKKT